MFGADANTMRIAKPLTAMLVLAMLVLMMLLAPLPSFAGKKKKDAPAETQLKKPELDVSKLVWPQPPKVPRIRYVTYFAGMRLDAEAPQAAAKQKWMDRLAGMKPEDDPKSKQHLMPFQLLAPHGMAVDSKGVLYVADQRVGAVFIFNTETREVRMIRNGVEGHFKLVNGVAIDDDDRIFVSDGKLHRISIFNQKLEQIDEIEDGLVDPVGLAIDRENRILYVADTQQDQVIAYDADTLKLLRKIGSGGHHELSTPGDFSGPTGVAVDQDGNLYVTDTMNYRVEIFDADGKFISQFGRHCDMPGCFAHPKGISIDSDGHVWVADSMIELLQVFSKDGELLGFLGGTGHYPGQFDALANVFVDKQNRVFTSEQYPGRVQVFRYVTDAEAEKLKKEKEEQRGKDRAKVSDASSSQPAVTKTPDAKAEVKQ
jgi:sugar lactone lactonase YvrE